MVPLGRQRSAGNADESDWWWLVCSTSSFAHKAMFTALIWPVSGSEQLPTVAQSLKYFFKMLDPSAFSHSVGSEIFSKKNSNGQESVSWALPRCFWEARLQTHTAGNRALFPLGKRLFSEYRKDFGRFLMCFRCTILSLWYSSSSDNATDVPGLRARGKMLCWVYDSFSRHGNVTSLKPPILCPTQL